MAWIDDNTISDELFDEICERYMNDLTFKIAKDIKSEFGVYYMKFTENLKFYEHFQAKWKIAKELRADLAFEYALEDALNREGDTITNTNEFGLPWITPNSANVQRSVHISKTVLLYCSHLAPWKYDMKALNKDENRQPIEIKGMVIQLDGNEVKKLN